MKCAKQNGQKQTHTNTRLLGNFRTEGTKNILKAPKEKSQVLDKGS